MSRIPKISDERLEELASRIKPVVRFIKIEHPNLVIFRQSSDGDLYYIEDGGPRNFSFIRDAKAKCLADDINLDPYKILRTIHNYATPAIFHPLLEDVLAQIPEEDIGRVVAFETNHVGFTEDERYHLAETKLYRGK